MDMESDADQGDGVNQNQDVQPYYPQLPDLGDIVREDSGTGSPVPDADGDRNRAHKAPTVPTPPPFIDGIVPPRDLRLQHQREHPELVEDLKTFLGIKASTTESLQLANVPETVELANPKIEAESLPCPQPEQLTNVPETLELADPHHAKPPQPSSVPQPACAAEAMNAYDGQAPGSEPEPHPAGDADVGASVLDCASPGSMLAIAGSSSHEHEAVHGAPRGGSPVGARHCDHDRGPASVEDKCLECCVYYGVLCCQCTIS